MVRATSSLPVPLSPVITTDADDCANRSIAVITLRIGGDFPNKGPSSPDLGQPPPQIRVLLANANVAGKVL